MKNKNILWIVLVVAILVGAFVYFGFSQMSIGAKSSLEACEYSLTKNWCKNYDCTECVPLDINPSYYTADCILSGGGVPSGYDFCDGCESHADYGCYGVTGDIYWKDGCGGLEEVKEYCLDGCNKKSCNVDVGNPVCFPDEPRKLCVSPVYVDGIFYCDLDDVVTCSGLCSGGECIDEDVVSCFDTDGSPDGRDFQNFGVRGSIKLDGVVEATDFCENGDRLVEYHCFYDGSDYGFTGRSCSAINGGVCVDGACVDGGSPCDDFEDGVCEGFTFLSNPVVDGESCVYRDVDYNSGLCGFVVPEQGGNLPDEGESFGDCSEDFVVGCADGTEAVIFRCVDGVGIGTGQSCPDLECVSDANCDIDEYCDLEEYVCEKVEDDFMSFYVAVILLFWVMFVMFFVVFKSKKRRRR